MLSADQLRLPILGFALAILSMGLAAPAMAQDDRPIAQEPRANDPRLVTLVFDESRVFTINGKVRVQTTIKFGPDESIQNVAVGDSGAWQIQPNQAQSILFVKPLEPNARTNMTVVTNRRTYLFDLVSSPRHPPLYVLQFRYPELEAAEAAAVLAAAEDAAQEQVNEVELAAANDPYAVSDPAALNFDWAGDGVSGLLPSRTYDNGEAVFLTWPAGASIPAILIANHQGDEGPVNYSVRGDTIVLDGVPAQIILRSGGDTATLTNNGPAGPRSASVDDREPRGS